MKPRMSVFDRSKMNGGFITGPQHAMLGGLGGMKAGTGATSADALQSSGDSESGEAQGSSSDAPNYRKADGMESCGQCMYFDLQKGDCEKYEFKTSPDMICDSFEPAGDQMNSGTPDVGGIGANPPPSNSIAY